MIIEIDNRELACFINESPDIDITPELLKSYVFSSSIASERRIRQESIEQFLFSKAIK